MLKMEKNGEISLHALEHPSHRSRRAGSFQLGVLPKAVNWEGDSPREPKLLRKTKQISARGDARPSNKGLGQHALASAATNL